MSEWISVADRLPINSASDELFDGCHYEADYLVLANGKECKAAFYACWEVTYSCDREFIAEFDAEGVTHWKAIEAD